jgi:hypothetical protein
MSTSSYKKARKVNQRINELEDNGLKWLLQEPLDTGDITPGYNLSNKPIGFMQEVHDQIDGEIGNVGKVINEIEKAEIKKEIPLPPEKYQVIYVEYGQENHEQSSQIPLGDYGEPDSVLFLWTTPPMLGHFLKLIQQWGFQYKTAFLWNKNLLNKVSARGELTLVASLLRKCRMLQRPDAGFTMSRTKIPGG